MRMGMDCGEEWLSMCNFLEIILIVKGKKI